MTGIQLPEDWRELVQAARKVQQLAYAPYSNFPVGCALKAESGDVFIGCNVENASYGLTICAERSAMCTAVSQGQPRIQIACISLPGTPVPCGTCRQFLYEFNPEMLLLLDDTEKPETQAPDCVPLKDLLPRAFTL